ncbi:hypothetical protein Leryth_021015 [Lithospermum erythrorhizon]|nr:hypothetical protein Leryth_021015 [Lithospermum erythrorhizon]
MTDSFLNEIREMSKQFFSLPMEEKTKYARTDNMEGYGNDPVVSQNQILDWTDRLYINVNPKSQQSFSFELTMLGFPFEGRN